VGYAEKISLPSVEFRDATLLEAIAWSLYGTPAAADHHHHH
jgi:hypothetical protein